MRISRKEKKRGKKALRKFLNDIEKDFNNNVFVQRLKVLNYKIRD